MKDLNDCGACEFSCPEMLFGKLYLMKNGDKVMSEITKVTAFKELLQSTLTEEISEKSFKFVSVLYLVTSRHTH